MRRGSLRMRAAAAPAWRSILHARPPALSVRCFLLQARPLPDAIPAMTLRNEAGLTSTVGRRTFGEAGDTPHEAADTSSEAADSSSEEAHSCSKAARCSTQ